MTIGLQDRSELQGIEDSAVESGLGLGGFAFVGLNRTQSLQALASYASAIARSPIAIGSLAAALVAEELKILSGRSDRAPDGKDRRFGDDAWDSLGWKQLAQSYLALRDTVMRSVDEVGLNGPRADRARFVLMQLTEAFAPTNNLLTNPSALRRAVDTRGKSLRDGARHMWHDARHNGGLPSQVDTRPFKVGENMAAAPGGVVRRTDQYELIQYTSTTEQVRRRPLIIIPPQINRYYFLDLAPGRSFIEHAVAAGQQVFIVSWRNPQPEHANWSLDTYVHACLDAIETASQIAGSKDVNTMAFCAGGMTQSMMLAYLAAKGRPLVNAATLGVTMIDTHVASVMNSFATPRSIESSLKSSRQNGGVSGRELARVFAWIRPNDLIWNYWVSNYLHGDSPPAFDVLAWNSDSTNLPNQIHEQFLDITLNNLLLEPGGVSVLGESLDLRRVDVDHYSVGAINDHLVPWTSCYQATGLFSGVHRFVLSNSGHIQALVNPPDNPKASYYVNESLPASAEEWLRGATRQSGSWWTDWVRWIDSRSGARKAAPEHVGSAKHPEICPAPGTYVVS